jgi:hypothetical protein
MRMTSMTQSYDHQRSQQHCPTDPAVLARAAAELARLGLKALDIASALGITEGAAQQLLKEQS